MHVVGSTRVPPIFSPTRQVFLPVVEVILNLPCTLILGASLSYMHQSMLIFEAGEGFDPDSLPRWIPLSSSAVYPSNSS